MVFQPRCHIVAYERGNIMELTKVVSNIVLNKACSIKPFKDADTGKVIKLRVRFDGVTLNDIFAKAMSTAVIQWQNGPGRSKFDQWENNQVVDIDFKAPGRTAQIDPEVAIANKIKGMDADARKVEINRINALLATLDIDDSE